MHAAATSATVTIGLYHSHASATMINDNPIDTNNDAQQVMVPKKLAAIPPRSGMA